VLARSVVSAARSTGSKLASARPASRREKVEQRVDQLQQPLRVAVDHHQLGAHGPGQLPPGAREQVFQRPQHQREGRAKLVAHVVEELGLRQRGGLGLAPGQRQGVERLVARGALEDVADVAGDLPGVVADDRGEVADPDDPALRVDEAVVLVLEDQVPGGAVLLDLAGHLREVVGVDGPGVDHASGEEILGAIAEHVADVGRDELDRPALGGAPAEDRDRHRALQQGAEDQLLEVALGRFHGRRPQRYGGDSRIGQDLPEAAVCARAPGSPSGAATALVNRAARRRAPSRSGR
jgi:hypothetical protein